jgi:hypothetical protein
LQIPDFIHNAGPELPLLPILPALPGLRHAAIKRFLPARAEPDIG